MSTNPLNLPLLLADQTSKHVTHNDAILKLSQAFANTVDISLSAGNVVVTTAQAQTNYVLNATGASVARTLTIPAVDRILLVKSSAANAGNVTVDMTGGTGTVVLTPGAVAIIIATSSPATVTGFFLSQSASVSTFLDLSDGPASYAASGTFLVRVNAGATGLEFVDAATVVGTPTLALDDLTDTNVPTPSDANVLSWSTTLSKWVAVSIGSIVGSVTEAPNDGTAYVRQSEAWTATVVVPALGTAGQSLRVNTGATALEYFTPPVAAYDVGMWIAGAPTNGEEIARIVVPRACSFADDFAGSYAVAEVAATGSSVFDVQKNGASVGSITFAAAGTTGTFATTGGATTFAAGDTIKIIAPATADATLADISITLVGTRT